MVAKTRGFPRWILQWKTGAALPMADFDDFDVLKALSEDPDLRAGALMDLSPTIASELDARISQINKDLQRVHLLAVSFADVFWEEVIDRRKANEKGSDLGVRVRRRDSATEISYYVNSYNVKKGSNSFLKGDYLRKSSANKYLERDFRKLYSWEKELIREMEKSFSYCRSMSKALVASRASLKRCKSELGGIT